MDTIDSTGTETGYQPGDGDVDALIIYAPSIRMWAERLDATLLNAGLSTWIDYRDLKTGISAWDQAGEVILRVKNIVVLMGPKDDRTDRQRIVAPAALKGVYASPEKRMIPLLLGDAKLPVFVRAAAHWTGRPIPSLRIPDPVRDWDRAVADLIEILKGEADPMAKGVVIDTTEEDRRLRQERMEYIRQVVEEMKIQEDRARLVRPAAKTA